MKSGKGLVTKENDRPILLMSIDTKLLNEIQTELNSTLKRAHIMIKLISFQGCKDGQHTCK
jgi:hypothetical protein